MGHLVVAESREWRQIQEKFLGLTRFD